MSTETEFLQAVEAAGLRGLQEVVADGNLHRFHVEDDRRGTKNGWYVLYEDPPAGAFGCWKRGFQKAWSNGSGSELTVERRQDIRRQMEEERARREKEQHELHEKAAAEVQAILEASSPAPDDHPYLVTKNVRAHGLYVSRGQLVVPLRDVEGRLWSLQRIFADGRKRFLSDGRVQGCLHLLGNPDGEEPLVVCEGYATAATIHETTGLPVAVAFNCGNLEPVARALRAKYPGRPILIGADDDRNTEGNPGRTKAQAAAAAVGGYAVVPVFPEGAEGTDFNDLAAVAGPEAVLEAFEAAQAAGVDTPDLKGGPRFRRASDLLEIAAERPDWLVEGLLARGCVTYLAGKVKAGKTTLTAILASAVLSGGSFLDYPAARSGVVYLTEERPATFRAVLERTGILQAENFHFLLYHERGQGDWSQLVQAAATYALEVGAGLLVIDTVSHWATVDDENDSAQALAAMRPLHEAAATGLAVLVVAHGRKGGGEIGDDARGSSAYGGAADILLSLRRMTAKDHESRRELEVISRFDGGLGKIVIEREEGDYRFVGKPDELERAQAREALLTALPESREAALSVKELLDTTGYKKSTLDRALKELQGEGLVEREKGAGTASNQAYGYWRPATEGIHHAVRV